jgi:hypothetical protein
MFDDPVSGDPGYRLHFEAVLEGAAPIEFPCNAAGEVDLDAFDEAGRNAYFLARIARGLHLAPRVIRNDHT